MQNLLVSLAVSLSVLCLPVFGQDDKVARGKYLVEDVARCQDCHTPHLIVSGELVKSAWLKGASIDFVSVNQPPNWRSKAPDITSTSPLWTRWGDDGMVKYLETGMNPKGSQANPPMPAYKLTHEDAVAVAAFLRSLK
jgi:mono/diheme cytochrome c family protein